MMVLGTAMLPACAKPPNASAPAEHAFILAKANSGIELRIDIPRDTISADDRGAVEMHYYIINGPRAAIFDNAPGSYEIRVERIDGESVPPVVVTSPVTGSQGQTTMELPARAVLGQVMNLRCIQDGAGYRGDPSAPDRCLGLYKLDQAGSYRVILQYEGPDLQWPKPVPGNAPMDSGAANARAIQVVEAGRRLADTASLVVTAR